MSLSLCILASGSGGNCTLLRAPGGSVLIDAGLGPRQLAARLAGTGATMAEVSAIVLTHLDSDHFRPHWCNEILRRRITVWACDARAEDLLCNQPEPLRGPPLSGLVRSFKSGKSFSPVPGVTFDPIALAHDADGSHGFLIQGHGVRVGFATDLGRVPASLVEQFSALDLVALESNYCPDLQANSPRPEFLKRRITGGRGHLSNEQAFKALAQIFDRHEAAGDALPRHVVLLHPSRQCNDPAVMRQVFSRDARLASRLVLTEQYVRTEWLDIVPADPALRFKTMLF